MCSTNNLRQGRGLRGLRSAAPLLRPGCTHTTPYSAVTRAITRWHIQGLTSYLAAMGKPAVIVHSIKCLDPKTPVRGRCSDCFKEYKRANTALNRQKKNVLIKKNKKCCKKESLHL